MVGRTDMLEFADLSSHWKAKNVDLYPILYRPGKPMGDGAIRNMNPQDHGLSSSLDNTRLIPAAKPALGKW